MAAAKKDKPLPTFKNLKAAIKAFEAGKLPKKTQLIWLGSESFSLEVEQKPVKNNAGAPAERDPHVFFETTFDELVPFLLKRAGLKLKLVTE